MADKDSWAPSAEDLRLAGLGLSVGGAVAQSIAAYQTGVGTRDAYGQQGEILRSNALLKEYVARNALRRGATEQNNIWQKGAQLAGDQRAAMAARGLALNEGSPLNILTDTAFFTQRNAEEAGVQATNEAWALRVQAASDEANASLMTSRAGAENPTRDAGGTLLTSLGRVAANWYSDPTRLVVSG